MRLNRDNFRATFERAISRGEKALANVLECYQWASENADAVRGSWSGFTLDGLREEIHRVFGIEPESAASLIELYGGGDGAKGWDRVKRLGAAEAYRHQSVLSRPRFRRVLSKIDSLSRREFRKAIDAERDVAAEEQKRKRERRSKAGRDLRSGGDGDVSQGEAELELEQAKARITELERENEELRARLAKFRELAED